MSVMVASSPAGAAGNGGPGKRRGRGERICRDVEGAGRGAKGTGAGAGAATTPAGREWGRDERRGGSAETGPT